MCRLRNIALESVTEKCDRRTDRRTDRQTDRQTDGQSDPYVSLCFAGDTTKINNKSPHRSLLCIRFVPEAFWSQEENMLKEDSTPRPILPILDLPWADGSV